ncbi:MAG: hypothetical protein ABJE47_10615 [bacterium]
MARFQPPRTLAAVVGLTVTLAFPCLGQCRADAAEDGRMRYAFTITVADTATVLHVILSFRGNATGVDELKLPSHWAGQTIAAMSNLRPLSSGTTISERAAADRRALRYLPNQRVVVAYDIRKDWQGPLVPPMQFHPVIMPQYLEINGDNGLVFPAMADEAPAAVDFDWRGLPPTWTLATSFGTSVDVADRCQSYVGPWTAVHGALFAAGDFRIHRFQIGGQSAAFAVRGEWVFSDADAITQIQKAVSVVRDFWHENSIPYFLVTLKPYDAGGSSDGSGFTNAFWLYLAPRDSLATHLTLLSHEAFHGWNVRRMGPLSDAEDAVIGWFHEGFTEYYADLLLYRAHLLPLARYLENVNRDLRRFPVSSNPYVRGRVIALWLDSQIRGLSNDSLSLDNLMFDMVRGAAAPLTQARILETAARYLSPVARAELARMVQSTGAEPTELSHALAPCITVMIDSVPTFDIGFDLPASRAAKRVIGVAQSSAAYKAGLRDGQAIFGMSVFNDQPDRMARITVQGDTSRTTVAYLPRGRSISVPQLHVREAAYASNPGACHA